MTTLAHWLQTHFTEAPDRAALHLLQARQPDRTISYRQLAAGAAGYAHAYEAAGLRPGDVVVLILQHGEALVNAFWGAVMYGAVPSIMPFLTEKLAPDRYRQELAALIGVTKPAGVVTYREFEPEVTAAIAEVHGPAAHQAVRAVLLAEAIESAAAPERAPWLGLYRLPADLVLLQHSSGTTGLQKGVALSNRAVLNQLECYRAAIRLAPDDVIVSWLPLYHDMGLIAGFVMPVISGVPLVLMSPFDWVRAPFRLLQAVTSYRGTLSWLPNFAYNFCAQKIRDRDLEGVDLSSWRAVINCSEPMRWESHEAFRQRFAPYGLRPSALATSYAMAENVFAVTQGGIEAPVVVDEVDRRALIMDRVARPTQPATEVETIKLLSAGQPLSNVRVGVFDDQRRLLPDRRVGELALQSDCMLTGYYHRPDLTAKAFFDGWYLTGDLGYLADGEVYVTGRKKDLIIVGGKNVYPGDLEALASEVEGIHPGRVVAFGLFNTETGTEDVIVVAEADTVDLAERERLAEAVRLRINRGSDVVVRQVAVVDPRWVLKTSSGKVARPANREKYLAAFSG